MNTSYGIGLRWKVPKPAFSPALGSCQWVASGVSCMENLLLSGAAHHEVMRSRPGIALSPRKRGSLQTLSPERSRLKAGTSPERSRPCDAALRAASRPGKVPTRSAAAALVLGQQLLDVVKQVGRGVRDPVDGLQHLR